MTYLVSSYLFSFGHVDRKKETKMETNKISSNMQTNIETFKKYTNPMGISTKKSVICSRAFHLNRQTSMNFQLLKKNDFLCIQHTQVIHSTRCALIQISQKRSSPQRSFFFSVLSQNLTISNVSWK